MPADIAAHTSGPVFGAPRPSASVNAKTAIRAPPTIHERANSPVAVEHVSLNGCDEAVVQAAASLGVDWAEEVQVRGDRAGAVLGAPRGVCGSLALHVRGRVAQATSQRLAALAHVVVSHGGEGVLRARVREHLVRELQGAGEATHEGRRGVWAPL